MPKTKRGYGSGPRITPKLERALEFIAWHACSDADAAAKAGMNPESLEKALRKPHVQGFLRALGNHRIPSSGVRSLAVIDRLTTEAKSEYVELDAAKHMASLAGFRANEPAQTNVNVQTNLMIAGSTGSCVITDADDESRQTPYIDEHGRFRVSRDPATAAIQKQIIAQMMRGPGVVMDLTRPDRHRPPVIDAVPVVDEGAA